MIVCSSGDIEEDLEEEEEAEIDDVEDVETEKKKKITVFSVCRKKQDLEGKKCFQKNSENPSLMNIQRLTTLKNILPQCILVVGLGFRKEKNADITSAFGRFFPYLCQANAFVYKSKAICMYNFPGFQ